MNSATPYYENSYDRNLRLACSCRYIESFNGKFLDECLNDRWLKSLTHVRAVIAGWRVDYSEQAH